MVLDLVANEVPQLVMRVALCVSSRVRLEVKPGCLLVHVDKLASDDGIALTKYALPDQGGEEAQFRFYFTAHNGRESVCTVYAKNGCAPEDLCIQCVSVYQLYQRGTEQVLTATKTFGVVELVQMGVDVHARVTQQRLAALALGSPA